MSLLSKKYAEECRECTERSSKRFPRDGQFIFYKIYAAEPLNNKNLLKTVSREEYKRWKYDINKNHFVISEFQQSEHIRSENEYEERIKDIFKNFKMDLSKNSDSDLDDLQKDKLYNFINNHLEIEDDLFEGLENHFNSIIDIVKK